MYQLVYILAASHSGSTLLAMLTGSHPQAYTVGELKATHLDDPDRYLCSCGEKIRNCGFWANVQTGMARRGYEFDITNAETDFRNVGSWYANRLLCPLVRGRGWEVVRDMALSLSAVWRKRFEEIQLRNTALLGTICELTGAKIIVDSSKIGLRLKYLLKIPHFRVRVIRLIRDGRGVALSYMDPARFADARDPSLRGGGTGGDREAERLSLAEAAYEWRRSNEEAEAILANLDRSQWMEVRYEHLCRQPKAVMNRIFEFIGLEKVDVVDRFRCGSRHVLGNGMRLDKVLEIQLDQRWKREMSEAQLLEFDAVAGAMNRQYGYA